MSFARGRSRDRLYANLAGLGVVSTKAAVVKPPAKPIAPVSKPPIRPVAPGSLRVEDAIFEIRPVTSNDCAWYNDVGKARLAKKGYATANQFDYALDILGFTSPLTYSNIKATFSKYNALFVTPVGGTTEVWYLGDKTAGGENLTAPSWYGQDSIDVKKLSCYNLAYLSDVSPRGAPGMNVLRDGFNVMTPTGIHFIEPWIYRVGVPIDDLIIDSVITRIQRSYGSAVTRGCPPCADCKTALLTPIQASNLINNYRASNPCLDTLSKTDTPCPDGWTLSRDLSACLVGGGREYYKSAEADPWVAKAAAKLFSQCARCGCPAGWSSTKGICSDPSTVVEANSDPKFNYCFRCACPPPWSQASELTSCPAGQTLNVRNTCAQCVGTTVTCAAGEHSLLKEGNVCTGTDYPVFTAGSTDCYTCQSPGAPAVCPAGTNPVAGGNICPAGQIPLVYGSGTYPDCYVCGAPGSGTPHPSFPYTPPGGSTGTCAHAGFNPVPAGTQLYCPPGYIVATDTTGCKGCIPAPQTNCPAGMVPSWECPTDQRLSFDPQTFCVQCAVPPATTPPGTPPTTPDGTAPPVTAGLLSSPWMLAGLAAVGLYLWSKSGKKGKFEPTEERRREMAGRARY